MLTRCALSITGGGGIQVLDWWRCARCLSDLKPLGRLHYIRINIQTNPTHTGINCPLCVSFSDMTKYFKRSGSLAMINDYSQLLARVPVHACVCVCIIHDQLIWLCVIACMDIIIWARALHYNRFPYAPNVCVRVCAWVCNNAINKCIHYRYDFAGKLRTHDRWALPHCDSPHTLDLWQTFSRRGRGTVLSY